MKFNLKKATVLQKSVHELLMKITRRGIVKVGNLMMKHKMKAKELLDVIDTIINHQRT